MQSYIARHGFAVTRHRSPWSSHPGGLIYELVQCPFDSTHTGGSAAHSWWWTESRGFQCHHNGCRGKTIKDVLAIYAPEIALLTVLVTVTDWPEIIPLGGKDLKLDNSFGAVPGWVGAMAQAIVAKHGNTADMAALLGLAMAAACVAAKA